jgi:hypothetical protein
MSNPFITSDTKDLLVAKLYDKAHFIDIGNHIAYTNGETHEVFINTEDNLQKLLPNYNQDMLKALLLHEEWHNELLHPQRYHEYVSHLMDTYGDSEGIPSNILTQEEVNVIMDILVHDRLQLRYPELVPIVKENYGQFRDTNSLNYSFKTDTLEQMIDEYREQKSTDEEGGSSSGGHGPTDKTPDSAEDDGIGTPTPTKETKSDDTKETSDAVKSGQAGTGTGKGKGSVTDMKAPELTNKTDIDSPEPKYRDWSGYENIDKKEFIETYDVNKYLNEIQKLKTMRIRLAKLTKTLNGLVTSKVNRTYSLPSYTMSAMDSSLIFKGKQKSKASLYLCFDASGSMSRVLDLFRDIISHSVPQALQTPCDWFTDEYGHGTYRDMMKVEAESGYSDDGDRVLELCFKAEQQGYTPIGVTDGGGGVYGTRISYDDIKSLKRTIIVTNSTYWAEELKRYNKNIQIINIEKND